MYASVQIWLFWFILNISSLGDLLTLCDNIWKKNKKKTLQFKITLNDPVTQGSSFQPNVASLQKMIYN